jgi:heme-degrading monooxygenase HmoA
MTKQLVKFAVTLRDPAQAEAHESMVRRMRELAEAIDGFSEWRDAHDGLDYWGFVVFDSDAAAQSWKGNPTHGAIHQLGEQAVYAEFHTEVFALDRENHWYRDDG